MSNDIPVPFKEYVIGCFICFLFLNVAPVYSQDNNRNYSDKTHYSRVFGKLKTYRLYLPDSYASSSRRFPVIYFFHGYGGNHGKDESAKLDYNRIKQLVDKYNVIMVMWSGNISEDEPRPYNIGRKTDVRFPYQMKDYFPELVSHIDSSYRTHTDRSHRGIIGFSMGGFMSFFLAGKYPDKVCAAVNLLGSPEFYIGSPDNPTLLQHRYYFENLRDIRLRFNNSTEDELVFLNNEVHNGAVWTGGLSYEYERIPGKHKIDNPGEIYYFEKAVEFVRRAFQSPLPLSDNWTHSDIYPDFDIRGYKIRSDKKEPGFIHLKNVSSKGFTLRTYKWLPDGPALNGSGINLISPGIYKTGKTYSVNYYGQPKNERFTLRADTSGRLQFRSGPEGLTAGIWQRGDGPDLIAVDYMVGKGRRFIRVGEKNEISVKLWNRAEPFSKFTAAKLTLQSVDSSVFVEQPLEVKLDPANRATDCGPFIIRAEKQPPADGSPASVRFSVTIEVEGRVFRDELIIPVFYQVPVFTDIIVDDGRKIKDSIYGKGNGDGTVSPDEDVMIYVNGHRARLYTDDPNVVKNRERQIDEFLPSIWADGFSLSSVIRISEKCPPGYLLECLASFETKDYNTMQRKLEWGRVILTIK